MRTVGQGAGRQVRPLLLERLAGSGQPLARGGHHSVSDRPQTVCRLSKMNYKRCSAPLPRENESVSLAKRLEPNSRKPRNMLLKHVLKYLRTHRIALQISRFTSICEPTVLIMSRNRPQLVRKNWKWPQVVSGRKWCNRCNMWCETTVWPQMNRWCKCAANGGAQ